MPYHLALVPLRYSDSLLPPRIKPFNRRTFELPRKRPANRPQEVRYLGSFSYGFTLNARRKPKYTIYAFNWYFRNSLVDLDAAGLMGIAPAGTESLVAAEVNQHMERSKAFQSADAIWSQVQDGSDLSPSN
jgi:hypothetical protein